jgi:hypothetical protein
MPTIFDPAAVRPRPRESGVTEHAGEQTGDSQIHGPPKDARSRLDGLLDLHVSAALRLIHGRSTEPWTLEGLARESGLSRSAFVRFVSFVQCRRCSITPGGACRSRPDFSSGSN